MKKLSILIILVLVAVAAPLVAEETVDVTGEDGDVKEITVQNDRLSYVQSEIRVNEGDTIRLTFENTGGRHDWVLDEFDAATDVINGGDSQTIEFTADEAGEYEFYCSVPGHRQAGMWGTFIVVE
ncbi:MAG: plastocyanin/azurin family copper-binding protein [Alkalispirochaeta sp.]